MGKAIEIIDSYDGEISEPALLKKIYSIYPKLKKKYEYKDFFL